MDSLDLEFEEKTKEWMRNNIPAEVLADTEQIKLISKAVHFGFECAFEIMFERMDKAVQTKNFGEVLKLIGVSLYKKEIS